MLEGLGRWVWDLGFRIKGLHDPRLGWKPKRVSLLKWGLSGLPCFPLGAGLGYTLHNLEIQFCGRAPNNDSYTQ